MYMYKDVHVYGAGRQVCDCKQTMKIPEEDWLYTLVKDVNISQSLQVVKRHTPQIKETSTVVQRLLRLSS